MKRQENASFTVEAALVMPIVLMVLFALIDLTFYLHDVCVLNSFANQALVQITGTHRESTMQELEEKEQTIVSEIWLDLGVSVNSKEQAMMQEAAASYLKRKLFLARFETFEVTTSLQKVTVTASATVQAGIPLLNLTFLKKKIGAKVTGYVYDPAKSVRTGTLLLEELDRTGVFDKIQSILDQIKG